MKKPWQFFLPLIPLGILLTILFHFSPFSGSSLSPLPSLSPASSQAQSPPSIVQYQKHSLPQTDLHTLSIPAEHLSRLTLAVADSLQTVSEFAQSSGAIAVLNAGFFDPQNQKSTSFITLQETLVADPRTNERLMENPKLTPYLDQILNRTELRRYQCQSTDPQAVIRLDIVRHQAPTPTNCQTIDAIGAGPQLLPALTLEEEAFVDRSTGRDAIGSQQANARTAIGLTSTGTLIWVLVAQKSTDPTTSGLTLEQLADWLKTQDIVQALNLDGGSSSSLYYQGQTFYGKVNGEGDRVIRPVKSVLLLKL
ncbi:MAG: phosphodiester glycosidase family protein [Oculatellaceae cyanobacterium Prado106]|jgi:hypothetical protein|nr:phosphodiester glycosidase family protein [Oculatellaceae cyanobacterium Prado106]